MRRLLNRLAPDSTEQSKEALSAPQISLHNSVPSPAEASESLQEQQALILAQQNQIKALRLQNNELEKSLKKHQLFLETLPQSLEYQNASIFSIRELFSEQLSAGHGLNTETKLLLAAHLETNKLIEQMLLTLQQTVGGVLRVFQVSDETYEASSKLEQTLYQVEQQAREANRLTLQITQEANQGATAGRKTSDSMRRLQRNIQASAKVVRALNGRSKEIGEILHVMDEIAGQTNLLAINAAILAAQAGEKGHGFLLIAEEVKELAERTASSTKEIDGLIRAVQREASQAIDSIEEGVAFAEEGVQMSQNSNEFLEKFQEKAEQAAGVHRSLAEAIQEQTFTAKRSAQEAENLRALLKQIHANMQTQIQSSSSITDALHELGEQIQRMDGLIQEKTAKQSQLHHELASLEQVGSQNLATLLTLVNEAKQTGPDT